MPTRKTLAQEKPHHRQAFEVYYGLGPKRSYRQVAEQLSVSLSAVKLMARSFSWTRRIHERDADVARRTADRAIDTQVNLLDRDQKIVHMALVKLAKGIADGQVKMQMGDLDRLIRLRTYLNECQRSTTPQTIDEAVDFVRGLPPDLKREFARKLQEQA